MATAPLRVASLALTLTFCNGCSSKQEAAAACAPAMTGAAPSGFADGASTAKGLAFAVVDLQYTSSRLLYNDLATGELMTVLTAESGDPALFAHDGKLVFFNRASDRRNFKILDPCSADFAGASEVATPAAGLGDPAALLSLSPDQALVAHYDAGKLLVMNMADGSVAQDVSAAWDFSGATKAQLRPVALLAVGDTTIYALHQGRNDDDFQTLNGTQQIFVLKRGENGEMTVADQDATAPGVQGIKLPLSNPGRMMVGEAGKVIVAGQCTLWDSACTAGFVEVDVATGAVTTLFDMSTQPFKGNGGVTPGRHSEFYALTVTGTADAPGAMAVTAVNLTTQTTSTLHEFPAESAGCCALYHDSTSHAVWVGDRTADGRGFFSIYKDGAIVGRVDLEAVPYSGLFLP